MTVKIGFEFDNHDEALVFLARVSSTKVAAPAKVPAEAAGLTKVVEPTVNKSRKPRNDAGKPRGEYKKSSDDGAAQSGSATQASTQAPETPAAPSGEPAKDPIPETAPGQPIPTEAECQAALTAVWDKVGADKKDAKAQIAACQDIFARFAVKRIGELPKEHYAEFVAKCEGYLRGEAV